MNDNLVHKKINLSGWATKDFSLEELRKYLYNHKPNIFEITKDFVDQGPSIKKTYKLIKEYKKRSSVKISYAGTTDFVDCSGMNFKDYLKYLKIQVSQANFLECNFFRLMIGGDYKTKIAVLERLKKFQGILGECKILIEIHGGWEGKIENIKKIVESTEYNFVIDFQNVLESDLGYEKLKEIIPRNRIEYYHDRNLNDYVEHEDSLSEKENWNPEQAILLWEPKLIKKERILEFIK